MKTLKLASVRSLVAASMLVGVALPFAPAKAQNASPDLARATTEACINVARSRGFTLDRVVTVTADGVDAAKAVLSLTRNGQAFKLTCGYSKARGAVFGDDTTGAAVTTQPDQTIPATSGVPFDAARLWWLLLPLIGLPLLLWLTRGKGAHTIADSSGYEAIVRKTGGVDVRSGPDTSYGVIGSLRDGQHIVLSGRTDNDWVHLRDGGWIPAQYVETHRYATS